MDMTGNYTDYLGMMLIVHCALLKRIIMLINSQIIIETLKLHGKEFAYRLVCQARYPPISIQTVLRSLYNKHS